MQELGAIKKTLAEIKAKTDKIEEPKKSRGFLED